MKTHDKILLAGELLLDAANSFHIATTEAEYAKCILLAGAVIGVTAPWLDELGEKSSQIRLAELSAHLKGIDLSELTDKSREREFGKSLTFYRLAYNSLKHAGKRNDVKPSDDLIFRANLKEEAYYLIGSAIDDYNKLPLSREVINKQLSDDLLTLLQSPWVAHYPAVTSTSTSNLSRN